MNGSLELLRRFPGFSAKDLRASATGTSAWTRGGNAGAGRDRGAGGRTTRVVTVANLKNFIATSREKMKDWRDRNRGPQMGGAEVVS